MEWSGLGTNQQQQGYQPITLIPARAYGWRQSLGSTCLFANCRKTPRSLVQRRNVNNVLDFTWLSTWFYGCSVTTAEGLTGAGTGTGGEGQAMLLLIPWPGAGGRRVESGLGFFRCGYRVYVQVRSGRGRHRLLLTSESLLRTMGTLDRWAIGCRIPQRVSLFLGLRQIFMTCGIF